MDHHFAPRKLWCILQQAYNVAQGNEKGEICQSAQNEELEPTEGGSTEVLHHQLFQEH